MPAGYKFGEMKLTKERSQKKAKAWDSRDLFISWDRSVFKILPNIYDEVFSENSQRLLAVSYFRKTLHLRQGFKYASVEPTFLRCIIVI